MLSFEELIIRSNEVKRAQGISLSVVALESTVLTHGLPRPQNFQLALSGMRPVAALGRLMVAPMLKPEAGM